MVRKPAQLPVCSPRSQCSGRKDPCAGCTAVPGGASLRETSPDLSARPIRRERLHVLRVSPRLPHTQAQEGKPGPLAHQRVPRPGPAHTWQRTQERTRWCLLAKPKLQQANLGRQPPGRGAATCQAPLPALHPCAEAGARIDVGGLSSSGPQGRGGKRRGGSWPRRCSSLWPPRQRGRVLRPRDASSPLSALWRKQRQGRGILGPGTRAHVCIIRRQSHCFSDPSAETFQLQRRRLHGKFFAHEEWGWRSWAVPRRQAQPGTGESQGWSPGPRADLPICSPS